MSNHKRGYVVAAWLLTVVFSIPLAIFYYLIGSNMILSVIAGRSILPSIPGFSSQMTSYSGFSYASLWRDQFVQVTPDHAKMMAKIGNAQTWVVDDWKVSLVDPETGATKQTSWTLAGNRFGTTVVGDGLLFLNKNQQYEVVDDVIQPVDFPVPNDCVIVLDQELVRLNWDAQIGKFIVSRRKSGKWADETALVLPADRHSHEKATSWEKPRLECICRDDKIYAFLWTSQHLYFREGLAFEKLDTPRDTIPIDGGGSGASEEQLRGWSLVPDVSSNSQEFGTLFEGKPAVLIVDEISPGHSTGHLYQLNGTAWSKVASVQFPFGTNQTRVLTRCGIQSPYIVATTSTGTGFAYVIDPPGAVQVKRSGTAETWPYVRLELILYSVIPIMAMSLSVLPGLAISLLALNIPGRNEVWIQNVRLATPHRRGLARSVDLVCMLFLPIIVGWVSLRNFDWLSLAESIHLKLDHPTRNQAQQFLTTILVLLIIQILLLVMVQGRWGITPGKWLFGLRTLRTTLRPSGFARSLAREILLVIETCYLLCWLPPLLSIALTSHRQRLGDLVSETIVVEHNCSQRDGHQVSRQNEQS